ncbi:hypothetical protein [Rhizobium jaguaris]|uniref:Uncharacterized protein n=1 Tax=Rhizobium jaguaris TaxID=1312183 RepID=A0A387FM38_9HYPH|nr:hypothetical protein [Rhizobium jaguaris]AYG59938.1 hypothetical protein CCGE525_14815 [Rhizobium jaguaris]
MGELLSHRAEARAFLPSGLNTVRSVGPLRFRSELARDYACLLDVDDQLGSWTCGPIFHDGEGEQFTADFEVNYGTSIEIVTIEDASQRLPTWLPQRIHDLGHRYRHVDRSAIAPVRLQNAKDLLQYARVTVSLSDRVRLLSALDEQGSLSLADCQSINMTGRAVPVVASLFLHRFIVFDDIDELPLGPDSRVRRR